MSKRQPPCPPRVWRLKVEAAEAGPQIRVVRRPGSGRVPVGLGRWCRAIARATWKQCGIDGGGEVSLLLVGDASMRELNRRYRNRDSSTDVMSFPQMQTGGPGSGFWYPVFQAHAPAMWGDVVINLPWSRRAARERRHPWVWEVSLLMTHGLLHLLGYDHQKSCDHRRMQWRQKRVLEVVLGVESVRKLLGPDFSRAGKQPSYGE